jgi:archaetidylinositol phosphate synthase
MVASPEPEESAGGPLSLFARVKKPQRRWEVLNQLVFRPLAQVLVHVFLPLRVPPTAVLLANAIVGLVAAAAIAAGDLVTGAILLQLKTVLDNADGQLARASGRTSALGRYLDTEADLVVNAFVVAALGHVTDAPLLAVLGFCALTIVLSTDFNTDVLYRRSRGEIVFTQPSVEGEGRLARLLARAYDLVFGPQDRLLQAVSRRRLERVLSRVTDPEARRRAALAYHDRATVVLLANFGLSTQLAVLALCLALGVPVAYLWFLLAGAALMPVLQLRREALARRALAVAGG